NRLGEPLAAELSAFDVVGGDEADVVAALQARVEDDDGNLLPDGLLHWRHESGFVERRDTDAGDAAADEAFHLRDLRVAIVFPQRSAPDDRDAEIRRGFLRARVDALPEDMRRAFRYHGNRDAGAATGVAAALGAASA